jgi:putative ABC transport system ATP-binding protein
MIHCQHLRKTLVSAATGTALHWQPSDINIERGEAVLISGPSGCGKTTLLNVIAGLMSPDEGTVEVNGVRVDALAQADADRFRGAHIGIVFQSFQLIPVLTVEENILLAARYGRRWSHAEATEKTAELLRRVGIFDRRRHLPVELSIGEAQRVALARAVINEPTVLLTDEPTASLDHANAEAVMELLFDLSRRLGITLVAVSHERGLAARFDRTIHAQGWIKAPHTEVHHD